MPGLHVRGRRVGGARSPLFGSSVAAGACVAALGLAALSVAACGRVPMRPRAPQIETVRGQVESFGLEGRTYVHDLGDSSSVYVHAVHRIGNDLMLEDIHGRITYVDGDSLNVAWEYYGLDKPFTSRPTFTPSTVMGISEDKLHVLTRGAGIPDPPPRRVDVIPSSAPVATDSTLYVATYPTPAGNKTVYAVSLGSGYIGWGFRTRSPIATDLAKGGQGAGDTFYFATESGEVYAFPTYEATESNPAPAWTAHAYAGVRRNILVDGDDLAVVADDGRLILYDRVTGHVRWEAYPDVGQVPQSDPMFTTSYVYYRRGGALHAYDRSNGSPLWAAPGATRVVAERDDFVLVETTPGSLCKLDAATGELIGKKSFKGVHFPTQPVRNGTIQAVTSRGLLFAVEHGW